MGRVYRQFPGTVYVAALKRRKFSRQRESLWLEYRKMNSKFTKPLRTVFLTCLSWGAVGFFIGCLMEFVDPHGRIGDIWPAIFGIPAALCGLAYAILAWASPPHSRVRIAILGAVAGMIVSTLPFIFGSPTSTKPIWLLALRLAVILGIAGAMAALISNWVQRWNESRR